MKKTLLLLCFLAAFSSCNNMWSDEDKNAYMQSCMDGGDTWAGSAENAKAICTCQLDKLMKKYNNAGDVLEHIDSVMKDPDLAACKDEVLHKK